MSRMNSTREILKSLHAAELVCFGLIALATVGAFATLIAAVIFGGWQECPAA